MQTINEAHPSLTIHNDEMFSYVSCRKGQGQLDENDALSLPA
jgi:hypothetical protein